MFYFLFGSCLFDSSLLFSCAGKVTFYAVDVSNQQEAANAVKVRTGEQTFSSLSLHVSLHPLSAPLFTICFPSFLFPPRARSRLHARARAHACMQAFASQHGNKIDHLINNAVFFGSKGT